MWTDNDTIQLDDLKVFMTGFHLTLKLENFSEPESSAIGWMFHQVSGRKDKVDWWAVTIGGLFYEISAGERELVATFADRNITEHAFKCLALRKGHRPHNILGMELNFFPFADARIA